MISERVRETDTVGVAETVAAASDIVIVDCWAEWCGPCHLLAPILDQLAADDPSLTVIKVDVEEHPDFARLYDVMSFPTLLFFRQGQLVQRLIGARPKAALAGEVSRIRESAP
ncbi:MAG TPA: thioredoxin [Acidimicrobiales bacterium]|nr:thioredoxin [Acidimicrobiales bacterium]